MRILYVAEIVGKPGIHCVKTKLAELRKSKNIDLVIANGDGTTGGFGIGKNHSMYLRKLGVDVITGGDQTFFKKDMAEHIDGAYYMLRPANLPLDMPGRGWRHYTVHPAEWADLPAGGPEGFRDGANNDTQVDDTQVDNTQVDNTQADDTQVDDTQADDTQVDHDRDDGSAPRGPAVQIAVISLLGQSGFDRIHGSNPFLSLSHLVERMRKRARAIILDFHATTTAEKYTMFHHADGMVTAVIGSGQRVQTGDAQVMPSGTAAICDAGRTGSRNSVNGFDPAPEIKKYLNRLPAKSEECWQDLQLQGVLLDVDPGTGYVTGFESVSEPCELPASRKAAAQA